MYVYSLWQTDPQEYLKGKSGQKVNKAQIKEYEKCKTTSHH